MIEEIVSLQMPVEERLVLKKNRLMPKEVNKYTKRISIVTGTHGDELNGQYVCYKLIEIINANRTDFENEMAKQYADNFGFFYCAGTDNHVGGSQKKFAGMESDTPIVDENDFIERVRASKMQVFAWTREE